MLDIQDALKMQVHTVVTFSFLLAAQFMKLFSIDFHGAEGNPVHVSIHGHDDDGCVGACGATHAENSSVSAGIVCAQIALALSAITLITDTGKVPWGKGKMNPIEARGIVWTLVVLKALLLIISVISLASFSNDPGAFTLPGTCPSSSDATADDLALWNAPDSPTAHDRFLAQSLGGILPAKGTPEAITTTSIQNAAEPGDNGYVVAACSDIANLDESCYNAQLNSFIKNKCVVVHKPLSDTQKNIPRLQIFNTNNVSISLGAAYVLLFFATGITVAQMVTFIADHVVPPKGQRGGYMRRTGYVPAQRGRGGARVYPSGPI